MTSAHVDFQPQLAWEMRLMKTMLILATACAALLAIAHAAYDGGWF